MMVLLQLFYEFFKVGLFAVGGGMATIPFLYDIAERTNWFTQMDLMNMIAVSESTPGPIGVNMATYVGYVTGMGQGGIVTAILGSLIASLGLVAPSIIVILIVAKFLQSFRDNKYVNNAFYGLRPTSAGLIAAAGLSVAVTNLLNLTLIKNAGLCIEAVNWKGLILAVVLWIFTNKVKKTKNLHPIIFIGISAVVGIVFSF
ncbi:chromate transporter [Bullifex sp.]|uniref:chromate transporter n=1 Tax=Bullifex sp. TaxID=2815808 RepID=UPI002A7FC7C6|nr:chromate transporter [Bullifex sp.]MDY4067503.1 chromate transporter [Bullifex sp.]